jgi:hypothetical protein
MLTSGSLCTICSSMWNPDIEAFHAKCSALIHKKLKCMEAKCLDQLQDLASTAASSTALGRSSKTDSTNELGSIVTLNIALSPFFLQYIRAVIIKHGTCTH